MLGTLWLLCSENIDGLDHQVMEMLGKLWLLCSQNIEGLYYHLLRGRLYKF